MGLNQKLLDILLELHGGNRSGILRIQKETAKKQLVLKNGLLVFAESNQQQEHLARVLIAQKLLTNTNLKEIAASMKTGLTSEEAILAIPGFVAGNLEKGRREQAIGITTSVLGWNECDFRFYPGDGLVRHCVNLGLTLPELVAISVRQAISNRTFRIPPQFLNASFSIAKDFADRSSIFPLNGAEKHVCSLLKSRMKAGEILPRIPAERGKPEEVLFCLYLLGLVSQQVSQNGNSGDSLINDPDSTDQMLQEILLRFKSANFYEILSVPVEASQEEIQNAYHDFAKKLHPDRFHSVEFTDGVRENAERVFAHINEAYLTLRNPNSRDEYNQKQLTQKAKPSSTNSGTVQPEEAAEVLFREGKSLLDNGDLETAVQRLKGCVWLCPEKAVYHYYLGIAEMKNPKLLKSAEQHLLKAIELEDTSAESHLALVRLYIDARLPRKAELQLQKAMLWDPQNSEVQKLALLLNKLS